MSEGSLKEALISYLDSYFVKRDLPSTLRMFSRSISGYGTGLDEKALSLNEFRLLYTRDIQQSPGPIEYIITGLHITQPSEDTGIVLCELNIRTIIQNQSMKLNNLRLSTVWTKKDTWYMEHMHISLPANEHEGEQSYPVKELKERNILLQRLVQEKTEELNSALKQVRHLAVTDKLTQLFNRIKIEELLHREIERSKRYTNKLSVILIDIDHFKEINDRYGNLSGDTVLKTFAKIMKDRTRKTDITGRWGGEEFIIICTETASAGAAVIAENLRKTFENHTFKEEGIVTASFGIAEYKAEDTVETVIARADSSLYTAKNNGKNQICIK